MHYKIPYITGFVDKYEVPINHDIDLDSIKIRKRDKDGTFGEMVYNFKVDCSSIPITIFVEDSCRQEYFLKYSYSRKCTSFQKNKIQITTNESDDYTVLHYENFFREGYRIDYDDWIDLLKYLGYEIEYKEVLDEEMERMIQN